MKILLRNLERGNEVWKHAPLYLYIPNSTLSIRELYHGEGRRIARLYSDLVGEKHIFVKEERAFESFWEFLLYGWMRQ